jgi:alpha-L-rhamnosidase
MNRRNFLKYSASSLAATQLLPAETLLAESVTPAEPKFVPIPPEARFLWWDGEGQGRDLYGWFRFHVTLENTPQKARFNIFADSCYRLFVNGEFIEFGPVRFDPRYPQYDTHDLTQHFKAGKNVLAIEVNYFGLKTYKAMPCRAGWIGWGEISMKNGQEIPLFSSPSDWKAWRPQSRATYAPKLSFALNGAERLSQTENEEHWHHADYDDSHWAAATPLADQQSWGTLAPRTIPFMSKSAIPNFKVRAILPLDIQEDRYSFQIPVPHFHEDNSAHFSNFIAYNTWIFSPIDQEISVRSYWGDNWLNGLPIKRIVDDPSRNLMAVHHWPLRKGWNHLFGKVDCYADILEQYFGLPRERGLVVSAIRDPQSTIAFLHSPVISREEYLAKLAHRKLPYPPEETLSDLGGWREVHRHQPAQSPCRETSWDDYAPPVEKPELDLPKAQKFPLRDYPQGLALFIELDHTRLLFPHLILEGTLGATVDITYSEQLCRDQLHLWHMHHYALGDRIHCHLDQLDWIPTQPRGFRYIKITVRNPRQDVILKSLTFRSAQYPVELKGRFRCSDPGLNEIWQMGVRTQATNMEDAFDDCVTRERGMYGRDSVIQYHNNLACFGDHHLFQRSLELFGQSPVSGGMFRAVYPNTGDYTITDFALNLVEGYRVYFEQTGDLERIRHDWPAILRNLEWFHQLADERPDHLLDADWPSRRKVRSFYGGFHGDLSAPRSHHDNSGVNCAFNCFYLSALQSALKLARILEQSGEIPRLQGRIDGLIRTIPGTFWDASRQLYSDNLSRKTHSIHANLLAIRAGVASAEQLRSIRPWLEKQLRCLFLNGYDPAGSVLFSPSFGFYIFEGLYIAELAGTAEQLIRQGWGWMLAQGLKTCPEYLNLTDSLCHAWSAAPVYFLSKFGLGIDFPDAPDLSRVVIKVQTGTLESVDGAWPHPQGLIEIKWHLENGRRVFDHIKMPPGVRYEMG